MVTNGVQSPANIGGLLRLLEAFGVSRLYCCNAEIVESSARLKRTARNAEKRVELILLADALSAVDLILEEHPNARLIALEISKDSKALRQLKLNKEQHLILVLGSEVQGISEALLARITEVYHIEMYGQNSSMNVTQAAAICLYSLVEQLL